MTINHKFYQMKTEICQFSILFTVKFIHIKMFFFCNNSKNIFGRKHVFGLTGTESEKLKKSMKVVKCVIK